jgi:CheY-like chemotaxis protein
MADNELALKDLRQIEQAWTSARQLTRQLLAFGRGQVLRPKNLDLAALVRSVRGMLKPLIGEEVELMVLGQDPVTVCCDAGQIEQALLNLAINARDAMPAGGKLFIESSTVLVSGEPLHGHGEVPPGAYGMLEVTDTGTGIDPATLSRVFEPFFTTKETGRGTGLGLATVHGIVKQSAGHVTVDSEPGKGTTFRMYFPAIDSPWDEPVAEDRVTAVRSTGSETVLLVDDNDAVRLLVYNVLTRAGYTVLASGGPLDALQLAERFTGSIDLLLTDVVMPVQSGAELAARLMVSVDGLQVLFMSGYARHTVGHHKIPQNALFIPKPFSPGDLLDAVRSALDLRESRVKRPVLQTIM